MKRSIAFFLAAMLLLICTGCGLWNGSANEPLIVVHSEGVDIEPYEIFRWSQSWTNNGWLSADSFYLDGELAELSKSFPVITYGDDFEIRCGDKVTVKDFAIYDAELQPIRTNTTQQFLNTLSPGTYYLLINVRVQGDYVPAAKDHAYSGYDCACKLIIE